MVAWAICRLRGAQLPGNPSGLARCGSGQARLTNRTPPELGILL
jgi:hypothetical protein